MDVESGSDLWSGPIKLQCPDGHSFADLLDVFDHWRPGHQSEHAKRERYLRKSYQNALAYSAELGPRPEIAHLYEFAANRMEWPGRAGRMTKPYSWHY